MEHEDACDGDNDGRGLGTALGVEPEGAWLTKAADVVLGPAREAAEAEAAAVLAVAGHIADVFAAGKRAFAVGAGHAQVFAMELCNRAGGLPGFVLMNLEDLRSDKRDACWQLRDSEPERDPANGARLLDHYSVGTGDVVLIASNSGRNGAIVELAFECRRRAIYTAAFTSRRHSTAVPSRHPSGLRLLEVAGAVVDNHCPLGDATVEVPGAGRAGAASTVAFATLAQMLTIGVATILSQRGRTVPMIVSANL